MALRVTLTGAIASGNRCFCACVPIAITKVEGLLMHCPGRAQDREHLSLLFLGSPRPDSCLPSSQETQVGAADPPGVHSVNLTSQTAAVLV
jgi:hypothetical protein